MNQSRLKPVNSPEEVPDGLSDEDQIRFWETHEITEEFLAKAEMASEDERPRSRTTPVTVRFDDFTLGRLKDLAESRNVGYQTLLKELVIERLYEEERRQGTLPAGQVPDAESVEEPPASEEQEPAKPREWQKWAFDFVKENEELLRDPDIDSITLSRLAKNASTPLLQLSQDINRASAKEGFPAARLRRMLKGYDRLKKFTEAALDLYTEKFGALEEDEEGEAQTDPDRSTPDVAEVRHNLEQAEGVVIDARDRFAM
jgi:hypothetical protein